MPALSANSFWVRPLRFRSSLSRCPNVIKSLSATSTLAAAPIVVDPQVQPQRAVLRLYRSGDADSLSEGLRPSARRSRWMKARAANHLFCASLLILTGHLKRCPQLPGQVSISLASASRAVAVPLTLPIFSMLSSARSLQTKPRVCFFCRTLDTLRTACPPRHGGYFPRPGQCPCRTWPSPL